MGTKTTTAINKRRPSSATSCNGSPVLSALNKSSVSRSHCFRIAMAQVYHASVFREGPDPPVSETRSAARRSAFLLIAVLQNSPKLGQNVEIDPERPFRDPLMRESLRCKHR